MPRFLMNANKMDRVPNNKRIVLYVAALLASSTLHVRSEDKTPPIELPVSLSEESDSARVEPTIFSGRSLNEVLKQLKRQGYNLIYSSELITNSMTIISEPKRKQGVALIQDLLIQFKLYPEQLESGHIVIRSLNKTDIKNLIVDKYRGKIIDSQTELAIPNATILAKPIFDQSQHNKLKITLKARSFNDGSFILNNLSAAQYRLFISAPGYKNDSFIVTPRDSESNASQSAKPKANPTSNPTFSNTEKFKLYQVPINEIVISTNRYDIEYFDSSQNHHLNQRKIEELSHLANDVNRAAVHFPGIAGGDASAELRIRGGAPYENKYFLDGMPLENPFHLQGLGSYFGVIDSFAIKDANIITGGAPVSYGEHLSGIIELQSADGDSISPYAIGANFLDAKVKGSGTFLNEDYRWFASARRGYIELVTATSEVEAEDIQPEYIDLFAKSEFVLSDSNTLSIHTLLNLDKDTCINRCATALSSDSLASHFWLNLQTEWSDAISSKLLIGTAELENNRSGFEQNQLFILGNSQIEQAEEFYSVDDRLTWKFDILKQDWQIKLAENQLLKAGMEYKQLEAEYLYNSTFQLFNYFSPTNSQPELLIRSDNLTPKGNTTAAYLSHLLKLTKGLSIESGIRWDKQSYTNDTQLSPRLNLQYLTESGSNIRFSWGIFHQSQGIHQLAIQDGQSAFNKAEKVSQVNFSYTKKLSDSLRFDWGLYSKSYNNLRPRYENLLGINNLFYEADDLRAQVWPESAKANGLEMSLAQSGNGRFNWSIHYALSEAKDSIDGQPVSRPWEQRHALSFIGSYSTDSGCSVNWINSYHSGWRTTGIRINPEGQAFDQTRPYLIAESNYQKQSPSYFRTDLRYGCQKKLLNSRLEYFFEVLNLFNQSNSSGFDNVEPIFTEQGTIQSIELNGNSTFPLIPSLGFIWSF